MNKLKPEGFKIQTPKFQLSLNNANSNLNIDLPKTFDSKQCKIIKKEKTYKTFSLF